MKKLKRTISLLLVLVMLMGILPTVAFAEREVIASGICGGEGDGTNLSWVVDSGETLSISGVGAMTDYSSIILNENSMPWWSKRPKRVIIGDGVTSIGEHAFEFLSLDSVTFGRSVANIKFGAFQYCEKLTSATLPDSVNSIGRRAFADCTSLVTVYFEGNAPLLEEAAFDSDTVTLYYIPDTVGWTDSPAYDAVAGTWNGYKLAIWEERATSGYCGGEGDGTNLVWNFDKEGTLTISGIGKMRDYDCRWTESTTPWRFFLNSIKKVIVENGVTTIGAQAFYGCGSLEAVAISGSVTSIGDGAFGECSSLKEAVIPDSVSSIGYYAYERCTSLKKVVIGNGITMINGETFSGCSALIDVTIGENVTTISGCSFWHCTALEEIRIPASVTQIDNAFSDCTNLRSVYFEGNAPAVVNADDRSPSFAADVVTLYYAPGTTGWTDSAAYDAEAGTWNGYKLVVQVVDDQENDRPAVNPNRPQIGPTIQQNNTWQEIVIEKETTFSDVGKSDYFYDAVNWAVENGITNGISGKQFGPNAVCTRMQVVTFLWRAAGCPEPVSSKMKFKDVPANAYYYDAVLWAVENGIVKGVGSKSFAPDAECTRGQIVTFLYRWMGTPAAANSSFKDVTTNSYCYEAVQWAVENGITKGMGKKAFAPDAKCTRAQIVTFLYRSVV